MNKKNDKTVYLFVGVIGYLMVMFFAMHIAHVMYEGTESGLNVLSGGLAHMAADPFGFSRYAIGYYIKTGLIATLVFAFFAFWLHVDNEKNRGLMLGKESGTAKWNNQLKQFNKKYNDPYGTERNDGKDNFILSQNVYLGMDSFKTRFNNNVLVIGGSGSGKSRFFVKPNLLQANCNYIVTDPSGELVESTGHFLEEQKYEIKIFNLCEMNKSLCYNPFEYIRDEEGVLTMIDCLITNTTAPEHRGGDPFWTKSEIALLEALCFYLIDYCDKEQRNFTNVMKLLRAAEINENNPDAKSRLDEMFDEVARKDPNSLALKAYKTFKMGAGKTLKSILISCAVRLQVFDLPGVARLTSVDTIDLASMAMGKKALFVVTPQASSTYNFLVSMLYSQLFETLYYIGDTDRSKLERQVRFLLDEFVNIGQIPAFTKKLATMRKYGISCSVILQNIAQIKAIYKDDWETIIGNCDSMVFLGGLEYSTLEYISNTLGKMTIKTRNSSVSKGSKGSHSLSYQSLQRNLLNPDELGKLPNNKCVVQIRSLHPFMDFKFDYTQHKNYSHTGDANDELKYINRFDNNVTQNPNAILTRAENETIEQNRETVSNTSKPFISASFSFEEFLEEFDEGSAAKIFDEFEIVRQYGIKEDKKDADKVIIEHLKNKIGKKEMTEILQGKVKGRLQEISESELQREREKEKDDPEEETPIDLDSVLNSDLNAAFTQKSTWIM